MAISLDRATEAIADRTDPARRHLDDAGLRRSRLVTVGVVALMGAIVVAAKLIGRRGVYPDDRGRPGAGGHRAGVAARADPERARLCARPDVVGLRDHRADRDLHPPGAPAAAPAVPRRGAVVHDPRRADADRLVVSGPRPAITTFAHARGDRRHRRVGARDGHPLAGPRRDPDRSRDRDRRSGSPPPRARPSRRRSARSTTCCRRCRSSSTSSRSST